MVALVDCRETALSDLVYDDVGPDLVVVVSGVVLSAHAGGKCGIRRRRLHSNMVLSKPPDASLVEVPPHQV